MTGSMTPPVELFETEGELARRERVHRATVKQDFATGLQTGAPMEDIAAIGNVLLAQQSDS